MVTDRASRKRFDRQKDLGLYIPESVVVVGCGGIGFWLVMQLAAMEVKTIVLFDGKNVDESNLNRTLYRTEDVGRNKADALRDLVIYLRPSLMIIAMDVHCTPDGLKMLKDMELPDLVFDCTDDYRNAQIPLYRWCKDNDQPYIRIGCVADRYMVTSHVPDWDFGPEEDVVQECGIHIPAWVAPPVIASAKGILKMSVNPTLDESELLYDAAERKA